HLESLNLFGTKISDESLKTISKISTLKKVYLWQTNVSASAVSTLQRENPELDIDTGANFSQGNTQTKG
ncbi:MAG: hypothetical protein AAFR66_12115, partial [Bacteroidota bacterium]